MHHNSCQRPKMLLLFFILLVPSFLLGAETYNLTIDEAVDRALNQSLSLKKNTIDLAETEYSASRLWAEIFPGFSLNAGLTILPQTPLFTGSGFSYNSDNLSYSVNLGISLSLNPSLKPSMRRIELAYRAELLNYENASKQLEIQVIKYFLNLAIQKKNISYMQENLSQAEQKLEKDNIAWRNGLLNEVTWLTSQYNTETARYNLNEARGNYQNLLDEFLSILGLEPGMDIEFLGNLEITPSNYDPEKLIAEHLPKRPDILSQRQTIERLELTRDITTLNSKSPSLNLSTSWRGGSPSPNTKGLGAPFTDGITGSITLNIPVDSWIPGTRQNQTIRTAESEIEKAKLDLQNIEISAKNQIRQLVSNLNSTWENMEIARLRVELAIRTTQAAEEGFNNGTVESRELDETRRDLNDARQKFLERAYLSQSLFLDLARALNVDWRTLTNIEQSNLET